MKTILIISMVFLLNACASNLENITIKQNNQTKSIELINKNGNYTTSNNYTFDNNSKIAIKFNTISPDMINDFEIRHNLKLEQILIIGDYIYSHKSKDILNLIDIISSENNVKTVIPLWIQTVRAY